MKYMKKQKCDFSTVRLLLFILLLLNHSVSLLLPLLFHFSTVPGLPLSCYRSATSSFYTVDIFLFHFVLWKTRSQDAARAYIALPKNATCRK